MLYSYRNHYPTKPPERIRLADGRTRTDSTTYTEEELLSAGYVKAPEPPLCSENERFIWAGTHWEIVPKEDP